MQNQTFASSANPKTKGGVANTPAFMEATKNREQRLWVTVGGPLISVHLGYNGREKERKWFLRSQDAVAFIIATRVECPEVSGVKEALAQLE